MCVDIIKKTYLLLFLGVDQYQGKVQQDGGQSGFFLYLKISLSEILFAMSKNENENENR